MSLNDVTVGDVISKLEERAPASFAFDWDNVGLQVGSKKQTVKKVMVTLDVLERVVDEAIENDIDLIIAHHPLLFVKLDKIDVSTPKGRTIQKLLTHNICVYASHTNLDIAQGGVNDVMSELLEIEDAKPLIETKKDNLIKLAVYVPDTHVDRVRDAISEAGAGHIGNYSHCTYQVNGEGTFKPQAGSEPYIGNQGELEKVQEKRIETILPKSSLPQVLDAMFTAHPYEEAAYDLYPLLNEGSSEGVGRIGSLKNPVTLKKLCERVKEKYNISSLRFVGDPEQMVQRVAVLGGSGEKYYAAALNQGADVYITGDMTFHLAQEAEEDGLAVIDPGHHVEKVMMPELKKWIKSCFETDVQVMISQSNTEPFRFS
ncbi:GTP cyclohydrolase 1 type 2 [Halobacillus andaensis]|uniref:GTP cyclohydrolase 1 type 2 homolog n=1 Tax=Halobacillus andaensis TaxID=1176239 RepID=A0A917AZD0_HALAA|nr:Nif3-like dinuclear metal center hexameric protein [Halobacillus andaensis]MBP2003068.1 dinuclear metal center YbgI/SA1388 family protein [Halobacillus andaensis]GGF07781.1 GTP cyclohydrolase 1 type 2 [Halobacillus andaensis]